MGIRGMLRDFARGLLDSVTPASTSSSLTKRDESVAARALAAAAELDKQSRDLPEGTDARADLVRIAEALRAFAAGERAKAALAGELSDPAIRQILKNANIRVD